MSPTECFKNHDIPFGGAGHRGRVKKKKEVDVVESLDLQGAPTSSWPTPEHLSWGPQPPLTLGVLFHGNEDPLVVGY